MLAQPAIYSELVTASGWTSPVAISPALTAIPTLAAYSARTRNSCAPSRPFFTTPGIHRGCCSRWGLDLTYAPRALASKVLYVGPMKKPVMVTEVEGDRSPGASVGGGGV